MNRGKFEGIHETGLVDIIDLFNNFRKDGTLRRPASKGIAYSDSISRAASGLTAVFPVLISESVQIKTAQMITKAIERKQVTALQLLISSYGISNADNLNDFLRDFHTNSAINNRLDLDGYMDLALTVAQNEGTALERPADYRQVAAINEDSRRNINFVFAENTTDKSISDFKIVRNGLRDAVIEGTRPSRVRAYGKDTSLGSSDDTVTSSGVRTASASGPDPADDTTSTSTTTGSRSVPDTGSGVTPTPTPTTPQGGNLNPTGSRMGGTGKAGDTSSKAPSNANGGGKVMISPSEVKKANEFVPSLLTVNIMLRDPNGNMQTRSGMIGVKAKMYTVDSDSVCTKIISKNVDHNLLLKLVKLSTREISFFKDFIFAIDAAKIDALSKSKRGSSNALFKFLERRALGGKIRKAVGLKNTCKAIFSIVITKEESNWIYSNKGVDLTNPSTVIPIMEALNLMYFVIADESSETISFLLDGDSQYETVTFGSLEKEQSDKQFHQLVNLVSQISR